MGVGNPRKSNFSTGKVDGGETIVRTKMPSGGLWNDRRGATGWQGANDHRQEKAVVGGVEVLMSF